MTASSNDVSAKSSSYEVEITLCRVPSWVCPSAIMNLGKLLTINCCFQNLLLSVCYDSPVLMVVFCNSERNLVYRCYDLIVCVVGDF